MKKLIGYRIRKLRESKDYSQENMGAELGITAGAYAKIERGETDPSATRLLSIAEILGVDINVFFHEAPPAPNRLEEPTVPYRNAPKNDIEELKTIVSQISHDMAAMKLEITALKKKAAGKKR